MRDPSPLRVHVVDSDFEGPRQAKTATLERSTAVITAVFAIEQQEVGYLPDMRATSWRVGMTGCSPGQ